MKIIAESSSTRTEWTLVEGNQVVEHAFTMGLNPYFQSRREISHCVRLELPEAFFRRRWDHVYFYGAGCANAEKCKIVESSLVAQFKTPVTVNSDLLGAARGLLVRQPGIAAILGTGSNSCLYDGEEVIRNVSPLGFILGDEGSGAFFGKKLVADILRGLAPSELEQQFFEHFNVGQNVLMEAVYTNPLPSRALAQYAMFLVDKTHTPYVYDMIYNGFRQFFERNIALYGTLEFPVNFVGSVAVNYKDILRQAASDFGVKVGKIIRYSMPGLIEYHQGD